MHKTAYDNLQLPDIASKQGSGSGYVHDKAGMFLVQAILYAALDVLANMHP